MRRKVTEAKILARQLKPVVAENLNLRRPEPMVPPSGRAPDREAWEAASFGAFWVGQATTLLRIGGRTVLTDPHFGERVGAPVPGRKLSRRMGRRRSTALPANIEDLPPVDVVMLSHAHADHWERESLERLASSGVTAVIPRRTRRLLPQRGRGFDAVIELDWEAGEDLEGLGVTAIRPRHWGARYLIDFRRGYNAYVIDSDARRIVFAADTGETDAFDHLGENGGVDVAVMGIGNSYEPWGRMHASPEQAAAMARRMNASRLMPVHHSTFRDRSEPLHEPLERLLSVWEPTRVICARVGESHLEFA